MKNIDAEIQQIYERMVPEIQKEIESFYQRYADKEGISLAEAKKRVSKFDVRAFEARAAKMVKERDFSDEANELMRLYNATMRINRLELLKADIGLHMIDGFDDLEKLTGERLTEEAVKEFERQAGILGNGVKGASERAKSLVGQSFMNATFSERIWSNQEALRNKLSTILTKGLIGGKSYQSLAAEIRKDFSVSAREAMRLVRTEMVRVQTQAQIDSYKANGWEEFEFLAYGTASCEICNALNKKHFKISDFQPAENAPPMHPNCRCRTAPYEDEGEYQKWLDSFGNSGKTIDSTGENNIIKARDLLIPMLITGARNLYSKEADEHAERYYGLVRSMTTDVERISKTTGFKQEDIQAVKDFLFYEEHDLGDGRVSRFDSDYKIAESWQRLINGTPEPHDITLLRHEMLERKLMKEGMSQEKAHIEASRKYNYTKEAVEYHVAIERNKKRG